MMPSHCARLSAKLFIGSLITVAMVCMANHAGAQEQSCKQTVEYLDSAKVAQTSYTQEQKQVQARIEETDKSTEALRQKLSTQQCRPTGGAADEAKQQLPACDALLKVILDAQKARTALEVQLADLKKKTTDAATMEQSLVKQATLNGCPPYGKAPAQKAAASKPAPKKTAQRPKAQPAARAQPEQNYGTASAPRSGPTIMFGGGGIGIGF
jgi:hypothetical protein